MEEHINKLGLRSNMNKSIEMEKLKEKIILAKIPLHENARNVVMGKGNPNACILFVGEAPGSNEDLQGIPFVGAAGKNLDKLLNSVGLSSLHGMVKLIEFQGLMIRLIPLFHPAAIIYNRRLISEWEKDMTVVKEELNKINLISLNKNF